MVRLIVILGQECSPADDWAPDFEASMKLLAGCHVSFHYPPHVEEHGIRMWHPYTPGAEKYWETQRAVGYHTWLGSPKNTANAIWDELDEMEG